MFRSFRFVVPISLMACSSDEVSMTDCGSDLEPVAQVAPELPLRLHNTFEGYAEVEFELREDGKVYRPRIGSAEWAPVGSARGEPVEYEEYILSAVSQWRYAPQEQQCRATAKVEIQFED